MNGTNLWERVLKGLALAGGAVSGLFGGFDGLMWGFVGCMAADYLSGLALAICGRSLKTKDGGLSSKIGAQGLARKGLMMLTVLVAALLDRALGAQAVFRNAALWFYIANEALSMVENLSLAGVPFPERLRSVLSEIKAGRRPAEAASAAQTPAAKTPQAADAPDESPAPPAPPAA